MPIIVNRRRWTVCPVVARKKSEREPHVEIREFLLPDGKYIRLAFNGASTFPMEDRRSYERRVRGGLLEWHDEPFKQELRFYKMV